MRNNLVAAEMSLIGLAAHNRRRACHLVFVVAILSSIGTDAASSSGITIDSMDTSTIGGYTTSYSAVSQNLFLLGWPQQFHLSNGSQWSSGAGGYGIGVGTSVSETVQDYIIQYVMSLVDRSDLLDYTDYDSGDHSSQGVLIPYGPLVLVATIGSKTATMHGYTEIFSNDITWYGEPRFNYYSAAVGQAVPFEVTYTLTSATWEPGIFKTDFYYNMVGQVDFTHPIPEPSTLVLFGVGAISLMARAWRQRRHGG